MPAIAHTSYIYYVLRRMSHKHRIERGGKDLQNRIIRARLSSPESLAIETEVVTFKFSSRY